MASIFPIAFANASTGADGSAAVVRLFPMLGGLAMLLGAFLLAVVLLTLIRRRRNHASHRKTPTVQSPNPWNESAARLNVDPPKSRQ